MATETGQKNLIDISQGVVPRNAATINALTDSTGATASDTAVANLADGTTYANDHGAIEANFATLTAKLNQVLTLLQNVGIRN